MVNKRRHRTQIFDVPLLLLSATRCEQRFEVGLVEHRRPCALFHGHVFGLDYIVFHALHIHGVVKLNDVALSMFELNFNDHPVLIASLHLRIEAVDKRVRFVDLAKQLVDVLLSICVACLVVHSEHAVDGAHYQLV